MKKVSCVRLRPWLLLMVVALLLAGCGDGTTEPDRTWRNRPLPDVTGQWEGSLPTGASFRTRVVIRQDVDRKPHLGQAGGVEYKDELRDTFSGTCDYAGSSPEPYPGRWGEPYYSFTGRLEGQLVTMVVDPEDPKVRQRLGLLEDQLLALVGVYSEFDSDAAFREQRIGGHYVEPANEGKEEQKEEKSAPFRALSLRGGAFSRKDYPSLSWDEKWKRTQPPAGRWYEPPRRRYWYHLRAPLAQS